MIDTTNQVLICDCVLRDGFQILPDPVPLHYKKKILKLLVDSGIKDIEITSMVPPKLVPQFGDAADMITYANEIGLQTPTVLVPNLKGAERAIAVGAKSIVLPVSVSETHSNKNIRKSRSDQISELKRIKELIAQQPSHSRPILMSGICTVFGCSYEGKIAEREVFKTVQQCLEVGVDQIGLADTVGYGSPDQVKRIFSNYIKEFGTALPLRAHFHDTFGLGLANVYAALDAGVRIFDASLCGLGGCPFAPNASGNITVEDLVFMMQKMGLKTGIDLDKLLEGQAILREALPDQNLKGVINRAGKYPADFRPELV
jgi:hydroxymethylglutaryl-CoA lyase